MILLLIVILLVLALLSHTPCNPAASDPRPSGLLWTIFLIVLILWMLGRI